MVRLTLTYEPDLRPPQPAVAVFDCVCRLWRGVLTVKPTPMKMQIIPIVMYAQQRLRGSALPTEDLPKSEPEADPVSEWTLDGFYLHI